MHGPVRCVAQRVAAEAPGRYRCQLRRRSEPGSVFAAAEVAAATQERLRSSLMSQVPVIDVSKGERATVHKAIDAACREWGAFQLVGHGIDLRLLAALRRQMHAFFAQPSATKRAISRTAANPWGFFDRELTRHTRDWKQIYDYGPADGAELAPQWPAALPAFQPIIREFYEVCDVLALRLLRVISRNLGMPADHLDANFHPEHTSFL